MSSSEEYKNKFENFLQNIIFKLTDTSIINLIHEEYNELMDLCIII